MAFQVSTTKPAPNPLEETRGYIRRVHDYYSPGKTSLCSSQHHKKDSRYNPQELTYGGVLTHADNLFKSISQAALTGDSKVYFTFNAIDDFTEAAKIAAAFQAFQTTLKIIIESKADGDHSPFCSLITHDKTHLTVSWDPQLFPNSKPSLTLAQPKPWGIPLANEERQKGEGTDCTLIFGEDTEDTKKMEFPAHLCLVRTFSPFFRGQVASNMSESRSKQFIFPTVEFTKEELESFMTFMYLQRLDLSQFPPSTAIKFLDWSFSLLSDALRNVALEYIYGKLDKLLPQDIVSLLFVQLGHDENEDLKKVCVTLLKQRPNFFITMVGAETFEDLYKSFVVAKHFKLKEFDKGLLLIWNDLSTSDQIKFVNAALAKNDLPFMERMRKFCEKGEKPDDTEEEKPKFDLAYKNLCDRISNFTVLAKKK